MAGGPSLVAAAAEKRCAIDGVPFGLHLQCWRCGALFGANHPEPGPDRARLGQCRRCWRAYLVYVQGGAPLLEARPPRRSRALTARQVADQTGRSLETVHRWIRAGILPAEEWPGRTSSDPRGRRWRIRQADVDALGARMPDSVGL